MTRWIGVVAVAVAAIAFYALTGQEATTEKVAAPVSAPAQAIAPIVVSADGVVTGTIPPIAPNAEIAFTDALPKGSTLERFPEIVFKTRVPGKVREQALLDAEQRFGTGHRTVLRRNDQGQVDFLAYRLPQPNAPPHVVEHLKKPRFEIHDIVAVDFLSKRQLSAHDAEFLILYPDQPKIAPRSFVLSELKKIAEEQAALGVVTAAGPGKKKKKALVKQGVALTALIAYWQAVGATHVIVVDDQKEELRVDAKDFSHWIVKLNSRGQFNLRKQDTAEKTRLQNVREVRIYGSRT